MITLRPHQTEALESMRVNSKGQVIIPTGGGKTILFISDCIEQLKKNNNQTIVVVAPRILLSEQLCDEFLSFIDNVSVLHVHSGKVNHSSTTNPDRIREWCDTHSSKIIFTTYHSLGRIQESGVDVDTIYFDESHNSVQKHFFPPTYHFATKASRCYFFTATPKWSSVPKKAGMNMSFIYGEVLCSVSATKLVRDGFIIPPEIHLLEGEIVSKEDHTPQHDCDTIMSAIYEHRVSKLLVSASSVKDILSLMSDSDFVELTSEIGYSVMYISASHGAFINGNKVPRDEFFNTLNVWGSDDTKRFIILHHSILSEGISVNGLEAVLLLRNMNTITMSQTIGRIIRLHKDDSTGMKNGTITPGNLSEYRKPVGLCIVPMTSKVGISTAKRLRNVCETIFVQGNYAKEVIKR